MVRCSSPDQNLSLLLHVLPVSVMRSEIRPLSVWRSSSRREPSGCSATPISTPMTRPSNVDVLRAVDCGICAGVSEMLRNTRLQLSGGWLARLTERPSSSRVCRQRSSCRQRRRDCRDLLRL